MAPVEIVRVPTAKAGITLVAAGILEQVVKQWQMNKPAHIALTGGRSAAALASAVDQAISSDLHSGQLHVWLSDERFVERDDPQRTDTIVINSFQGLRSTVFHQVGFPSITSVHAAAHQYAQELDSFLGNTAFDAVVLSLGEDGHIAALFPGHSVTRPATASAVAVVDATKPPALRVSMGLDRIAHANAIYVLVFGQAKRSALNKVMSAEPGTPLSMVQRRAQRAEIVIATDLQIG